MDNSLQLQEVERALPASKQSVQTNKNKTQENVGTCIWVKWSTTHLWLASHTSMEMIVRLGRESAKKHCREMFFALDFFNAIKQFDIGYVGIRTSFNYQWSRSWHPSTTDAWGTNVLRRQMQWDQRPFAADVGGLTSLNNKLRGNWRSSMANKRRSTSNHS